jgi:2-polyprenyl-3-methyl-5-hydroxy-6-metoxy-1,4-benzoquinol methylase
MHLETIDYFLTAEPFSVVECLECKHMFTNPQPHENDLGLFYDSSKYLSHKEVPETFIEKFYALIRKINLRTKYNQSVKNLKIGNVLDYGCGRGDFLHIAMKKGWNSFGVEMDEGARNFAIKSNGVRVFSPKDDHQIHHGQMDLITMFHVLEHIADIHSIFAKISNWLTDNGRLVIALPNRQSFDAKHYGNYWAAWDVPRHLHHFNQDSLMRLTKQYGFEVKSVYPMCWDAFFVSLLSEQYKQSNLALVQAGLIGLYSNISALLSKQYSSLLYVFSKLH